MNHNNSPTERLSLGNKQTTAHGHYNLSKSVTSIEKIDRHKCIVKFLEEKLRHHLSWSLDRVCVRGDSEFSISDLNAVIPDIWIETISDSPVTTQQVVETSLVIAVIDTDEDIKIIAIEKCLNIPSLRELVLISVNRLDVEIFNRGNNGWASSIYDNQSAVLIEAVGISFTMSEISVNFFTSNKIYSQGIAPELITYKISSEIDAISNTKINEDFQIPYRPDILPMESGRGYLIRLAEELGYISPLIITNLIGAKIKGIDNHQVLNNLASILRYSPQELKKHFYCNEDGPGKHFLRFYFGHTISAKYLNLQFPRLCPLCITESPVIKAQWDINQITVCPIHRCELIDTCPKCQKPLLWHRAKVSKCKCGFKLNELNPTPASLNSIEITKVIYHAIDPSLSKMEYQNESNFNPELLKLSLPNLLKVIEIIGVSFGRSSNYTNKLNLKRNNLKDGLEVVEKAALVLADWPNNYYAHLRIVKNNYHTKNTSERSVIKAFGVYYHQLFRNFKDQQFNFFIEAFEQYLNNEWDGVFRTSLISSSINIHSQWLTPRQASKLINGLGVKGIRRLYLEGKITGTEKIIKSTGRREIWIERKSLDEWIKKYADQWMSAASATKLLGLSINGVLTIAKFGLINFEKGRLPGCESRTWLFEASKVKKINEAFMRHQVPNMEYKKNTDSSIALHHAFTDMLSHDIEMPNVIKSVIEGELIPIGRAGKFSGIRDYIFNTEDLRKYRSKDQKITGNDFLNLTEVKRILGVHRNVITLLHKKGFIDKPTNHVKGRARFILAESINGFKEKYILSKDLAKSIRTSTNWVSDYLNSVGVKSHILKMSKGHKVTIYERRYLNNIKILPSKNKRINAFSSLLKSLQQERDANVETEQFKSQLTKKQIQALPIFFTEISDPRKTLNKRHKLCVVLAIVAGANLCGIKRISAISNWAKDLSQEDLKLLGCYWEQNKYVVPSRSLIGDLLMRVDQIDFNDALKKCYSVITVSV